MYEDLNPKNGPAATILLTTRSFGNFSSAPIEGDGQLLAMRGEHAIDSMTRFTNNSP